MQTMAEREGFVTLSTDPSFIGESGGETPDVSPDINGEDFGAAVRCLGIQPFVDRKIGIWNLWFWWDGT